MHRRQCFTLKWLFVQFNPNFFMTTKKDPEVKENVDRNSGQTNAGINNRNNNDEGEHGYETVIKNANASGAGAIGRNDEKQTGCTSNHSENNGKG